MNFNGVVANLLFETEGMLSSVDICGKVGYQRKLF